MRKSLIFLMIFIFCCISNLGVLADTHSVCFSPQIIYHVNVELPEYNVAKSIDQLYETLTFTMETMDGNTIFIERHFKYIDVRIEHLREEIEKLKKKNKRVNKKE